jgi:uncharacterized protein (UPF0548 family)
VNANQPHIANADHIAPTDAAAPTKTVSAKSGWVSRAVGFVKQLVRPPHKRVTPMPPPPAIPEPLLDDEMQLAGDGFGALLGRQYTVRFVSAVEPVALMDLAKRNLDWLSPDELAGFEKTNGTSWTLKLGDEFDIQILGPWNGRVRVIEVSPTAFSFVTLRGHPEAGRIRFAVSRQHNSQLRFSITSWARSRDAVVDLGYSKLGVGKGVQTTAWRTFLERVVQLGQGRMIGEIDVSEQVLEETSPPKNSSDAQARPQEKPLTEKAPTEKSPLEKPALEQRPNRKAPEEKPLLESPPQKEV